MEEKNQVQGPVLMEGSVTFRSALHKAEVVADLEKMGFLDKHGSLVDTESKENMIILKYGQYEVPQSTLEFLKDESIGLNLKLAELTGQEQLVDHEYDDSSVCSLSEYAEEHNLLKTTDEDSWKTLVREHFFKN